MLDVIVQAFQGIFTILFVVGVGYVLSKKGWFDESSSRLISRLVTEVALPCYLMIGLSNNFTLAELTGMLPDMALPFFSVVLAMLAGYIATSVLKIRKGRKGVFCTNFFISNTIFIGLPVNQALFGDESIPPVMLYYIVNTLFFWTIGLHNIVSDTSDAEEKLSLEQTLKKVLSIPLLSCFGGLLLIVLNVQLPAFLISGMTYVGNLTTPLSLIFIGIEISKISLRDFHFEKDILWGMIGRFVICPLCLLVLIPFFPVSSISARVFTMQAAMPAMTQMAIVAKQYGADSQYAAALSFITIISGLAVIPVYMIVASLFLTY